MQVGVQAEDRMPGNAAQEHTQQGKEHVLADAEPADIDLGLLLQPEGHGVGVIIGYPGVQRQTEQLGEFGQQVHCVECRSKHRQCQCTNDHTQHRSLAGLFYMVKDDTKLTFVQVFCVICSRHCEKQMIKFVNLLKINEL